MSEQLPDWVNYYPPKCEQAVAQVITNKLTPADRKTLWSGVQKLNPQLADTLTNDPAFLEAKRIFNGTVMFEQDDFDRYMQAGKDQ